ncbi:MAG: DUF554 family protein [Clostridia bacterium]|nr:DUF554 family protein [Clostridia bacterium]
MLLFFSASGYALCGSILPALQNDSSQLYLKSIIDCRFALIYGGTFGNKIMPPRLMKGRLSAFR